MPVDFLGFAYAATVAAGGIMGYVKASSVPSLAAGLAFGAILGYGSFLTSQDPPRPLVLTGTSLVLGGIMGKRFLASGKFMPPGLVAGFSAVVLVRTLMVYHKYLPVVGSKSQ